MSLVLEQALLSGAAAGGGVSLIAALGGIFNNVTDISWGQMLQNMAFSAAFAEVFYNLSKAVGTEDNVTEGNGKANDKSEGGSRTAGEIIEQEKKGSINREFPDEWRDSTMKEIDKAAKKGDKSAKKARKLLKDKDFDKGSNSSRSKKGK